MKTVSKTRKVQTGTKTEKARKIFARMKGKERADVIAAFVKEAKLTKSGANTYYQNIKSGK